MHDLKIPVADLLGRPGEYRDVELSHRFPGVAISLARLAGSPVKMDLKAESVVEGILVTGRAKGKTSLQCARCLRTFASEVSMELCELFVAPGHEPTQEEDAYRVRGSEIDLGEMMRDALTLALPLKPVCDAGCKGLCATCGADLNFAECSCSDDDIDPRWAALANLRDRLES